MALEIAYWNADQALKIEGETYASVLGIVPVLVFKHGIDGHDFEAWFAGRYPPVGTGAVTINVGLGYYANTVVGATIWEASMKAITDDVDQLDKALGTAVVSSADSSPTVMDEVSYVTIALDSAAKRDNVAAGEYFLLRLRRLGFTNASDTMAAWARVLFVYMEE